MDFRFWFQNLINNKIYKAEHVITNMARKTSRSVKTEDEYCCKSRGSSCGGAVYGLGFIGAAVYYISTATGFWIGVLGVLKALVWPAFLVYEVLKFLLV